MKSIAKILVLAVLALLSGCATPKPSTVEYVNNPHQLNWVKSEKKTIRPVKIFVGKGVYGKGCTKEQIGLGEAIAQHIKDAITRCPGTYELVDQEKDAELLIITPVQYVGRSKDSAYSNSIPTSALMSLANKPGQAIANTLTKEIMGQSVRSGAASSLAGILFMAYDIGNFVVDGIQAIGHLYSRCLIHIVDRTPQAAGRKPQIFRVFVGATIDLEGDDRAANVAKFVPKFADPILPLFVNDQMCKPASGEGDKNEEQQS